MDGNRARLTAKGKLWVLSWDGGSSAEIQEGSVSPGYGMREASSALVLSDAIEGATTLRWSIAPLSENR
jgi:hypothetical protein